MRKKLPYPAWVNIQLKPLTKEHQQELRGNYFSNSGRVKQYDNYKAYCKANSFEYDSPPEGYWESKEEPWHKPAGWAMVAGAFLTLMLGGVATSGIRTRKY